MSEELDPLWYKDAVIYQLHVKAFFDANNDGIGDFEGLTEKLDYVQELGVNTLWLLPFYKSPLRDDGYDIADYRELNPSYGTMHDFRAFVRAAHARGLRVITELVINHTSDQHPWFQRARAARPGSSAHDFYVWSDTDQRYRDTRIIFSDTETSNWAWDPVAKKYYWHRFFSHQPDLNFDNPRVLNAVINVMRYWLSAGVDGLRLDAVPYLCEREGTNNENLPETHAIIRQIRAALDQRYPSRMLLGEANQWPEDVRPYFGEGDECHMAFHFPLMPRLYMALAQEDRHPIVDIMRQTPEIPDNCQWATFLRNHDELTLEMVTNRERDYLWNFYAADRRARINFGIRRRLAPLMGNDRRKIELLNALLLSMPGTPVIYYGDELGMGDNIFLGDRNGVRTPMQWSPDRNGGFSKADPSQLYLPALMDPIYGFEAINVEAQRRTPNSLLNWMRQLIAVSRGVKAFGRGTLRFLDHENRKVLAFLRQYGDESVLCVANLSRSAQPVSLDLREFAGRQPLELLGRSVFPNISATPYFVTLPAYGFFWFALNEPAAQAIDQPLPDLMTLVIPQGWASIIAGSARAPLERLILPKWLMTRRWYGAKGAGPPDVELIGAAELPAATEGQTPTLVALLRATPRGQNPITIPIALSIAWEDGGDDPLTAFVASAVSRVRRGARVGVLYEAAEGDDFPRNLAQAIAQGRREQVGAGLLYGCPTAAMPALEGLDLTVRRLNAEQSNTSVAIGNTMILKLLRRLEEGPHPEAEMSRFLTETSPFANTPALFGTLELTAPGRDRTTIATLQRFVLNQGDGWKVTLDYLDRSIADTRMMTPEDLAADDPQRRHGLYLELAKRLGSRTGELHRALAVVTGNAAFDPEPLAPADRAQWRERAVAAVKQTVTALEAARPQLVGEPLELADRVIALSGGLTKRLSEAADRLGDIVQTRIHGDYHLGQVLVAQNDFFIVDFEGEPAAPLAERRAKSLAMRDVAGMIRSFDYAGWSAVRRARDASGEDAAKLARGVARWRSVVESAFLQSYQAAVSGAPNVPPPGPDFERQLFLFTAIKALYEVRYELANRPDWIGIPLTGVLAAAEAELVEGVSA